MIRGKKNKKGFSLLELIVVMGVVAVLMGLGITGLINFRSAVEFQGAYSEFVENLKSQQNKAKNSVAVNGTAPFLYGLFINSNLTSYTFGNCDKVANNNQCFADSSLVPIQIVNKNVAFDPVDSKCSAIAFVRLPGLDINIDPILAIDSNGKYNLKNSMTNCLFTLRHTKIPTYKTISINLKNGTIDLQ